MAVPAQRGGSTWTHERGQWPVRKLRLGHERGDDLRASRDLDLWIGPGDDNARHVMAALVRFGAPVQSLGISEADLRTPGMVVQIGLPPRRISGPRE